MERGIREGMVVYSSDGERLGKVISLDANGFLVEKGFFFPKEYYCRFDHVSSVTGDDVHLFRSKDELSAGETAGAFTGDRDDLRMREDDLRTTRELDRDRLGTGGEEIRMTAAEEELEAVKRQREAGEVSLRKEVVHETKRIDVPVTREEVHVERKPIDAPRPASGGEARFQEESISMPIREEEVEIRKRPVVKEEVRLRRERVQGEQRADADVRREEIHVDDEEARRRDLDRGKGLGAPGRDDDLG